MLDFTSPSSSLFIFLLSTRAGGLGINLASADTVILYDSDWNPQMDLQAMDRAHRIGQKNIVNVYRFITKGTVEEHLNEKQLMKLKWDSLIVQQGHRSSKHFSKDEIKNMIDFGVSEIFTNEKGTYTDEDIDLILRRGAEKAEENMKILDNYLEKHKNLLNLSKGPAFEHCMYDYDNIQYNTQKKLDFLKIAELRKNAILDESSKKRRILQKRISEESEENTEKELTLEEALKLQNLRNSVNKRYPNHQLYEDREKLVEIALKQEAFFVINRKGKEFLSLENEEIEEKKKLEKTGFSQWKITEVVKLLHGFELFGKNAIKEISEVFSREI